MTQEESAGGPGGVLVALPAATVHLLKSSQVDSGEGGWLTRCSGGHQCLERGQGASGELGGRWGNKY